MRLPLLPLIFTLLISTWSCADRSERSAGEVRQGEEALAASDFNLAMEHFDRAIGLDDQNARAYFGRANVHTSLGAYEQALADYSYSLGLDPANPDAWFNRGSVHSILGKRDKACADYKEAYRLGKLNIWDKVKACPDPPERRF